MADHPSVGRHQIVEDVVGLADVDVELVGPAQRPGLDPGERIAGVDEVPGEPEATRDQRADDPDPGGAPAVAGADGDHADGEQPEGRQQVELGAERQAGGEARNDQCPVGQPRLERWASRMQGPGGAGRGPLLRIGVDQDRGGGQEEEQPHRVVLGVPRLVEKQHVGVQHQSHRHDRDRTAAVDPRKGPGGEQAERRPADVEQRREEIVAEEEDPGRVEQLRVLRVEPDRQVEDLGEVERADLVVLDEAGREGRVLPGRVGQVHADVEAGLRRHRPVGDHQDCCRDRGAERIRPDRRRGQRRPLPCRSEGHPDCATGDQAGEQDPPRAVEADDPNELEDDHQQREAEHDLGEPCRGAREAGQEAAAHADGGEAHGRSHGDQLYRAGEVVPEAHVCAAAPSFAHVAGSSGPVIL